MKRRSSGKTSPHLLRRTLSKLVKNVYPGCTVRFVGRDADAGPRTHGFGFSIVAKNGAPLGGVIWLNPSFYHRANQAWLREEVRRSQAERR